MKWTIMGLLTVLVLYPGPVSGAEIYSVQVGVYQNIKNAENQCQSLRRMFEPAHREPLRIEKKGAHYAVRIGQFNQERPARQLLSQIKMTFPQAFLWKGEYEEARIVRVVGPTALREEKTPEVTPGPARPTGFSDPGAARQEIRSTAPGKPVERGLAPAGRDTAQGDKDRHQESSLGTRRAILWGTVLESSPLTGNPLGLVPEKEIIRVLVRIDKSEAVKGQPNFFQDKETEEIILFSETRQPFFFPAQKIKALVEYQGDKYKSLFWIKQAEPVKP